MITLYTAPTANCRRVAVTIEELELPRRVIRIDREAGDQKRPEFLAINPAGLVPAIVDDDGPDGRPLTLVQSGAILLYLAEKTGRFLPKSGAARALSLQWLQQVLTDVNVASSNVFLMKNVVKGVPANVVEFYDARFWRYLGDCERALGAAPFLAGDLSIADFALYPVVAGKLSEIAARPEFGRTVAWAARLAERPGVRRGMAA